MCTTVVACATPHIYTITWQQAYTATHHLSQSKRVWRVWGIEKYERIFTSTRTHTHTYPACIIRYMRENINIAWVRGKIVWSRVVVHHWIMHADLLILSTEIWSVYVCDWFVFVLYGEWRWVVTPSVAYNSRTLLCKCIWAPIVYTHMLAGTHEHRSATASRVTRL